RTCRPTIFGFICQPALGACMTFVGRPHESDKHIYIEQMYAHSPLASKSRTCLLVIRGESGGRSNTRIPFTNRVGWDALIPRRTSSETALLRPRERFLAYCFTRGRMSSSKFRVVLIYL